jgi:hypothetical protein
MIPLISLEPSPLAEEALVTPKPYSLQAYHQELSKHLAQMLQNIEVRSPIPVATSLPADENDYSTTTDATRTDTGDTTPPDIDLTTTDDLLRTPIGPVPTKACLTAVSQPPKDRSAVPDAAARDAEQRMAWEVTGKKVWKTLPQGFNLVLDRSRLKATGGACVSTERRKSEGAATRETVVSGCLTSTKEECRSPAILNPARRRQSNAGLPSMVRSTLCVPGRSNGATGPSSSCGSRVDSRGIFNPGVEDNGTGARVKEIEVGDEEGQAEQAARIEQYENKRQRRLEARMGILRDKIQGWVAGVQGIDMVSSGHLRVLSI